MRDSEQPVVDFFLRLQRSMAIADVPVIMRMFAPHFLEANPSETRMRSNDQIFHDAMEERLGYLRMAGMRDVKALQIDPTPLGAGYTLVRVRWSVWFTPVGTSDFVDEFLVDYLVHPGNDGLAIATAIAHDDDADIVQRIGLTQP
jgi:hypothetical protein